MADGTDRERFDVKDKQRDIFPFFDLPRELRDAIYEEAVHQQVVTDTEETTRMLATDLPCPHLLTINRQFAKEYKSQVKQRGILEISDDGEYLLPASFVNKAMYDNAVVLKINLWCPYINYLRAHRIWVDDVLPRF